MLPDLTTPAAVARYFDVSRETSGRLEVYADLLRHWQKVQNLVAPSTLDVLWQRHIADSLQIAALAPEARTWMDLGSGAGFPGMVIAIALSGRSGGTTLKVHLVESNTRKCAFLAEVARKTLAPVEIHGDRIELLVEKRRIESLDVVTARALAPLGKLLGFAHPFLGATTRCLFPKGREAGAEIEEARSRWQFDCQLVPSLTDAQARIAVLTAVSPFQKGMTP